MRSTLLVLLLAAGLAVPARAQSPTRVGVGISLGTSGILGDVGGDEDGFSFPVAITLPILAGRFRIEPEFGLVRTASSFEVNNEDVEFSTSAVQLGAGLALQRVRASTAFYGGARGGVVLLSSDSDGTGSDDDDTESSILYVGPMVGGEYFFSDDFSLGGEAQVLLRLAGEDGVGDTESTETLTSTRGLFFVRFYF